MAAQSFDSIANIRRALDETVEHRLVGQRGTGAIPRIIHQTNFNKNLPLPLRANVDALRALNPCWEHRLYDDADVIKFIEDEYGPAILQRYLAIAPGYGAARADLFRYLLIYRMGGVYLDVKSGASQPFDAVLRRDDAFIVSQWRDSIDEPDTLFHPELRGLPGGEFQQWHIIAAPGHPFLRAVIERVLHLIDSYNPYRVGVGRNVIRVTGPIPYTLAIEPLLSRYPHRRVRDESAIGLRYSVLGGQMHEGYFRGHYSRRRTPIVGRDRGPIANAPLFAFLMTRGLIRRALKRFGRN
jgi:inositol phosphorylceramide mannosyltransferase catalytic subunit